MEENSIRLEDIPNAITGVLKKKKHGLRLLNYVLISQHIR